MDLQFLKFWGEAVRQSNTMQILGDEISRWMKGDIKETDELYALFRKYYGLEQRADEFKEYENQLKEWVGSFQKSFNELLPMLGLVSKSEYDNLLKQYNDLKKKVSGLEDALKDLEKKLGGNAPGLTNAAGVFDEMVKVQKDQFQNIMNIFSEISGIKTPKDENK